LPADSLDYNPSFSADRKWIVFTSERAGSADIYRVHPDSSGLERLTYDPAFDDQAALSPDGSTLVFVSTREGGFANLWLQDLSTTGRSARPIAKTVRSQVELGRGLVIRANRTTGPRQRLIPQIADTTVFGLGPRDLYDAILTRDRRFDGRMFVGVRSTRIYCRPICTVRPPRFENCTFYRKAAAAEAAGFRPCLRCRPELAPGSSAPVDAISRLAALAIRRIEDGALSEMSLDELAAEFGR